MQPQLCYSLRELYAALKPRKAKESCGATLAPTATVHALMQDAGCKTLVKVANKVKLCEPHCTNLVQTERIARLTGHLKSSKQASERLFFVGGGGASPFQSVQPSLRKNRPQRPKSSFTLAGEKRGSRQEEEWEAREYPHRRFKSSVSIKYVSLSRMATKVMELSPLHTCQGVWTS